MSLNENVVVIREKRKELLKKVDEIRALRKQRRINTPCIYFATVLQIPRTKEVPNPPKEASIQTFNVKGGNIQPRVVTNMLRRRQMPIAYDLPTSEQAREFANKTAEQSQDGDMLKGEIASYLAGENPYDKLKRELDRSIRMTLTDWENEDLKEKVSELQKRADKEDKKPIKKGGTNAKDKKEQSGS